MSPNQRPKKKPVNKEPEAERTTAESVVVIGVRFQDQGKVYDFDPGDEQFSENDAVIVETARGMEYGRVVIANREIPSNKIVAPLKRVIRRANEEDVRHYHQNIKKSKEAFEICQVKIEAHKIPMKLIDVEYTFDNSKLLFYFTAEGRVDFRELVKDLAAVFHTRIELRQIGIRDEAKLMGGLGICGRPFCCRTFLNEFAQVSIKMAKEQNLSLNSSKISGTCGRLMCCLRYEHDVYLDEIQKTPRIDSLVETPEGEGIVTETNPLAGMVRVKFLNGPSDVPPKVFHRDEVVLKEQFSKKKSDDKKQVNKGKKEEKNNRENQ